MKYRDPLPIDPETQPARLRKKGILALAPFVMLVWMGYWVGMISQTCCLPLMPDAHHSTHSNEHDDHHHDGELVVHEHDTPTDHEGCPELKSVDLVPASTVALLYSPSQPVLLASLHLTAREPILHTPSSYTHLQQSHPPPNRFLRTRRLLI